MRRVKNRTTQASSSLSRKRGAERAPPRELKLHASVLCYYESNSTIVVERSSGARGCESAGGRKEGGVGRGGCWKVGAGSRGLRWNRREGSGVRSEGYNTSVDTGRRGTNCERHITPRRAYGRKREKRRERNSGGFRARKTPNDTWKSRIESYSYR